MADDNKNENEDQDDFFGDDDDFGLPDLEYEALDDDDKADEPLEEEIAAETPEEPTAEPEVPAEPEPEPEPTADSSDDDFGLGLEDDFEPDSTDSDASSSSDDVSSEDFGDDFYNEDDFKDFDASDIDLGEDLSESVFDSDDLGEDEFNEFESELDLEGAEKPAESASTPSFSDEEAKASKSKFIKIVVFGTIVFVALGFTFWYAYNSIGEGSEQVAKTQPKKAPAKKPATKPKPKPAAEKPAESTASTSSQSAQNEQSTASTPTSTPVAATPGTITTIEARTGNSFVIVGSFVDEDIAADFANKLASEGKSPSIIAPYGNGLFHRVAIAGYPTVAAATQNLDSFKGEYGQDVWVLKY